MNPKLGCIEHRHQHRDQFQDYEPSGAVAAWAFCLILSAGSFGLGYLACLHGWAL